MLDLAALAEERGGIDSFTYISTAYVAGNRRGSFGADDLDLGQGFHHPYERSKFEAETLVRERAERTKAQVLRPSIVVGDSRSGWTRSFNVIYSPLRAFSRRALTILPARRQNPVDVVPSTSSPMRCSRSPARHDLLPDRWRAGMDGRRDRRARLRCAGATGAADPSPFALPTNASSDHAEARQRAPPPGAALERSLLPLLLGPRPPRRQRCRCRAAAARIEVPALGTYFDRLLRFAEAAAWGTRPMARHTIIGPPTSRPEPLSWSGSVAAVPAGVTGE